MESQFAFVDSAKDFKNSQPLRISEFVLEGCQSKKFTEGRIVYP